MCLESERLQQAIKDFHDSIHIEEINRQLNGVKPSKVIAPPTIDYELPDYFHRLPTCCCAQWRASPLLSVVYHNRQPPVATQPSRLSFSIMSHSLAWYSSSIKAMEPLW